MFSGERVAGWGRKYTQLQSKGSDKEAVLSASSVSTGLACGAPAVLHARRLGLVLLGKREGRDPCPQGISGYK